METKLGVFTMKGIALSEGIGIGGAFVYRDVLTRDISFCKISKKDIAYEMRRIRRAFVDVKNELYVLSREISKNFGRENGDIFIAQKEMLEDPIFIAEIETEMRNELLNAEQVVRAVFRKYIRQFGDSNLESLQSKADDLKDLLRKALRSLLGIDKSVLESLPARAIVIAPRLLPSDTVRLDKSHIAGIVVQEGSLHSHSALLARSQAIPAVLAKDLPLERITSGVPVIVDGNEGMFFHNPPASIENVYKSKRLLVSCGEPESKGMQCGPAKMKSGGVIKIFANVADGVEVEQAVSNGCDGIGLFRTETFYLESKTLPTENELYHRLADSLKATGKRPVTLRLIDIGGDKKLPYMDAGDRTNPFLGVRGIRLLLKNPELLQMQLRVFVRLRKRFDVRILVPMITLPEELYFVRKTLESCLAGDALTGNQKKIPLGSMIETPAAVMSIKDIIDASDFISIGTNDLTQYVMAADRESPDVSYYYEKGAEHMFTLVKQIADAARERKKECCICGEMANDLINVKRFIDSGVDRFSVSPHLISKIKKYIQNL